jgi:hypothetical protein
MYNLYRLNNDTYQIHSSFPREKAMEGTLLAILTYCTFTLGFSPNELQNALLSMLENDMDSANFGINRTFIFPFNRSDRKTG